MLKTSHEDVGPKLGAQNPLCSTNEVVIADWSNQLHLGNSSSSQGRAPCPVSLQCISPHHVLQKNIEEVSKLFMVAIVGNAQHASDAEEV